MDKNITLKAFVEGYEKNATESLKERYIKEKLKVETYLPYLTKVSVAENIIKQSSYARDAEGQIEKPERIRVNSSLRYVLFVTSIIKLYTNIETDKAEMATEFDMLNKAGLIEVIFKAIPEKEIAEFKTVLDMQLDDFWNNEYNTQAFISNQITRITDVLGVFLEPLLAKFENMDAKDLEKLIGKADKVVSKFAKIKE